MFFISFITQIKNIGWQVREEYLLVCREEIRFFHRTYYYGQMMSDEEKLSKTKPFSLNLLGFNLLFHSQLYLYSSLKTLLHICLANKTLISKKQVNLYICDKDKGPKELNRFCVFRILFVPCFPWQLFLSGAEPFTVH